MEGGINLADSEGKRMAGDYEIFQAIEIGTAEIVLGENLNAPPDERYMCAYCTENELFRQYTKVMVSSDYTEIFELFQQRMRDETEKLKEELAKPTQEGIDDRPVTTEGFTPVTYDDDLKGKVILIRADVFKREYQRATHQYQLCTGGFGASPHSRGSACFCTNLYTGKESRFERQDVLGIVERAELPDWANDCLKRIEKERNKDKGAR